VLHRDSLLQAGVVAGVRLVERGSEDGDRASPSRMAASCAVLSIPAARPERTTKPRRTSSEATSAARARPSWEARREPTTAMLGRSRRRTSPASVHGAPSGERDSGRNDLLSTAWLGDRETDCMFMNCNIVMTTTIDNPYCAIHSHIYIRHSSRVPCISNGEHGESQPGRGPSPPRGLRPLGSGGKCLVRGAGSRGGAEVARERAPAHSLGILTRLGPTMRRGNDADRARAVPARALRDEPP
jgi:hypothetical protein